MVSPDFRGYIDARMAAMGITSVVELMDVSDVGRDTLYKWQAGTRPSPRTAGRVARTLGVSYREFMDAWEGRDKQKDAPPEGEASIAVALSDLADAIRGQTLLLAALAEVQAQQSVRVESNSERIEALAAVLERLIQRDAAASTTPVVRRATKG